LEEERGPGLQTKYAGDDGILNPGLVAARADQRNPECFSDHATSAFPSSRISKQDDCRRLSLIMTAHWRSGVLNVRGTKMNPETLEAFVDADEAAKFISLTRRRVLDLARTKRIPGHPIGDGARRVWRFRLSEIAAAIAGKK
jgi:hypothetical protein